MIYLDGHATTPLAPEAAAAMSSAWAAPGNPGSPHAAGAHAAQIVEAGRADVAALVGAAPSELIFTAGATEANNIALLGVARVARAAGTKRRRVLITAIEHKSVHACSDVLRNEGFEIVCLPVKSDGLVDIDEVDRQIDERTLLISVGGANGEIGVVQPIGEITALAHQVGVLVHSDLAQLVGKLACDVVDLNLDYASLSSHKMYGPVGIGALYIAAGALAPLPLLVGGGQEKGYRPGTVAHPLVAGFGAAANLAKRMLGQDQLHVQALADIFLAALNDRQVLWRLNGDNNHRLPGSLNIQLIGTNADSIVERVAQSLAISTGSACQSGHFSTSPILREIGLSEEEQRSSLRILFCRYNTQSEAHMAADLVASAVRQERLATGGVIQ